MTKVGAQGSALNVLKIPLPFWQMPLIELNIIEAISTLALEDLKVSGQTRNKSSTHQIDRSNLATKWESC